MVGQSVANPKPKLQTPATNCGCLWTIRLAQTVTEDADEIDYCVMDVFDFAPPVPIDFVVSSLVTHHMSDDLIAKSRSPA